MRKIEKTGHTKGLTAEHVAMWYLRLRGYTVIRHRYKTTYGEIDIIAQHQYRLCFIEVKHRPTLDDAAYAITPRAQQRIAQTAECFLAEYVLHVDEVSFDAIFITPQRIMHLPAAWMV